MLMDQYCLLSRLNSYFNYSQHVSINWLQNYHMRTYHQYQQEFQIYTFKWDKVLYVVMLLYNLSEIFWIHWDRDNISINSWRSNIRYCRVIFIYLKVYENDCWWSYYQCNASRGSLNSWIFWWGSFWGMLT